MFLPTILRLISKCTEGLRKYRYVDYHTNKKCENAMYVFEYWMQYDAQENVKQAKERELCQS